MNKMRINSLLVLQCMFDITVLSESRLGNEIQFERFGISLSIVKNIGMDEPTVE